MPSTYSPLLGIELIPPGEQSNTWGYTTNTNLGTIIEQSIAGQVNIVLTTSSHTLTDINGAADEARNMILNISGVLATTGTIICPTNSKVYVITNNTSGGHDVEIKTASGLGVLVPPGTSKVVFCDGTDVYEAVTAVDTLLLGGNPTTDLEAVPRQYVDNLFLPLAGGTLTGPLTLPGAPVSSLQATTKNYVDANFTRIDGATMTGPLILSADPVPGDPNLQAATKHYVDIQFAGSGYVPSSLTLTAGTGLTGGGDLTANRTFALGTSGVTRGTYTNPTLVVDDYGRITSATNGGASGVTSVTAAAPLSSSGGTTPQISFTGTLAVANGGTGSSTASGALASLGGVSTTGSGATGTWNISILGNAATASSATNASQLGGIPASSYVTSSSGTAYNASNLGSVPASQYVTSSSGTAYNASNLGGTPAASFATQAYVSSSYALADGSNANYGSTWHINVSGNAYSAGFVDSTYVQVSNSGAGTGRFQAKQNYAIIDANISASSYHTVFTYNNQAGVTAYINLGGILIPSDSTLKDNQAPLTYGLTEILQLQPKTYNLKLATEINAEQGLPPKTELGLIAQEVEQVIPEIVAQPTEEIDVYSLNYTGLIPVLIKAIQELSAEVEALKAKLK